MKKRSLSFHLFRYQILPIARFIQLDLYDGITSIDDLLLKKNEFFYSALRSMTELTASRTVTRKKTLAEVGNSTLFRIAAKRTIKRETEVFTEEEMSNWPSFHVFVCNDPDKQIIAVQERKDAFQSPMTFARALADTISKELEKSNLRVHLEPILHEMAFWNLISQYRGRIRKVCFELITPNMSNISSTLRGDLKNMAVLANATQMNLSLESDKNSSLLLDKDSKEINDISQYVTQGGGNVSLRVRGIKRTITTKKSTRTIEFSELEISNLTAEEAVKMIGGMLDEGSN